MDSEQASTSRFSGADRTVDALGEILQVISQSRADETPVLEAIVRNAARLCNSPDVGLHLVDEARTRSRLVCVSQGDQGVFEVGQEFDLDGPHQTPTTIREGRVIHNPDIADDPLYRAGDPIRVKLVDVDGVRSRLSVPLLKDGAAFGCINLNRHEVRPFTDAEIALIEAFAAQAVIAIENVRQFQELQSRLEREAATREILTAISQSREDEIPVFDVILENALRLCDARFGCVCLHRPGDTHVRLVAQRGMTEELLAMYRENPPSLDPERSVMSRAILSRTTYQKDLGDPDAYPSGSPYPEMVANARMRQTLCVPLIVDAACVGLIVVYRQEPHVFDEPQVALAETFAAQAAIAIENVRQFRELQARLEREAATREVLQVISRSRDDDNPVFEAILENASRLCKAPLAFLSLANEDRTLVTVPALRGARSEFANILADFREPIERSELVAVYPVATGDVIQIDDMKDTDLYRAGDPRRLQMVDVEGVRSVLAVPLLRDGVGIGGLVLYRREVAPFSADDLGLVRSFAAQAVIAIENVRQFRELQTRLEREEASRQILGVISRSRDDEQPVFDTILRNASRLCDVPNAWLMLADEARESFVFTAFHGDALQVMKVGEAFPLSSSYRISETIRTGKTTTVLDLKDTDAYRAGEPVYVKLVDQEGLRTRLNVPLMRGEFAIGCIVLSRREVKAFSDDEITLIETFAAQAVIAIENVRQFREVTERLERETAIKNILRVISESRDDEAPVFEAILDSATRLCGTPYASLVLGKAGDAAQVMAAHRESSAEAQDLYRSGRVPMDPEDSLAARAIIEGRTIHVPDMAETEHYRAGHERFVILVDRQGLRTNLFVPLMTSSGGIGCFIIWKKERAPFTDDQIAMIETFAAHAVIAIENVQQFRALEALNAELGDRVEEQVGEIERMGRLKRFLSPAVANAVISTGDEKILGSHRALISVLFCDIRGFTAFCETAEPEETIEVLQKYHEEMGVLLHEFGVGVDHRSGDGIMAIFNDPLPCDDPAGDALRMALAMRARMEELCRGWKRLGHRLGFGVGISLGYATVGMVGSEGRFEYTASGTTVNLAARLCDEAVDGEILLSPRAFTAVEDDFEAAPHGDLSLKGIAAPVAVYRVIGPKDAGDPAP